MPRSTKSKVVESFKLGDRVNIHYYAGPPGRIVELRGPLGPGGAEIYRVLLRRKPVPAYIEVRGDQLELAPPKEKPNPVAPTEDDRA